MGDSEKLEASGPDSYRFVEHRRFLDALFERLDLRERVVHPGGLAGCDWPGDQGVARRDPLSWR
jgi:haloalkane dehalogenase